MINGNALARRPNWRSLGLEFFLVFFLDSTMTKKHLTRFRNAQWGPSKPPFIKAPGPGPPLIWTALGKPSPYENEQGSQAVPVPLGGVKASLLFLGSPTLNSIFNRHNS
jgi:hypothetical protein